MGAVRSHDFNQFWDSLAHELGVEVPRSAAERANRDESYRDLLLAARSSPGCLLSLFTVARNGQEDEEEVRRPSSVDVVGNAFGAIVRWGLSGFKTVNEAVATRRWESCQTCPNLVNPPDIMIYHLGRRIVASDSEQRVCRLCGCFAKTKTTLTTETCPDASPENPGMSRWGEPLPSV